VLLFNVETRSVVLVEQFKLPTLIGRRTGAHHLVVMTLDNICHFPKLQKSENERALRRSGLSCRQRKRLKETPTFPLPASAYSVSDDASALIYMRPQFLDTLWDAALAADGVLRSITLSGQPQDKEHWAIFEISLNENIEDHFELAFDKGVRPKISPPRADPAVVELRGLRAQLRSRGWSDVAIIAVGVLVALWIARLWRCPAARGSRLQRLSRPASAPRIAAASIAKLPELLWRGG
jgi:hypothetical protein